MLYCVVFLEKADHKQEKQDRYLPDKPSWSWPTRPVEYDQSQKGYDQRHEEYDERRSTKSRSEERKTYYAVAKWEVSTLLTV